MTDDQFATLRDLLIDMRDNLAGIRAMQAAARAAFEEEARRQAEEEALQEHFRQRRAVAKLGPILPDEKGN